MPADRLSAARRAPWRARVGARLRCERGDTLIEVMVGALMVALIAVASLGAFTGISHLSGTQRSEEQAAALAQQDQARLRGLTIAQLTASGTGTGNTSTTTQVNGNGTIYKVTSKSVFISGSTGNSACSGAGADEVQTTSTVTWGTNFANAGRHPVIVHGLITPDVGGAIVAVVDTLDGLVSGSTGVGATGATVTLSGPTAVTPVTVDSSGCAVFSGLSSGTYTVSYTMPPAGTWTVYPSGAATIPNQTVSVSSLATTNATTVYIAQMGAVSATFQTTANGSTVTSGSDQFVLTNSQLTPSSVVEGSDSSTKTVNTFATTVTTPSNVFPFNPSMANSYLYTAAAGGCSADTPTGTHAPTGFTVASNATTNVTIPEPAMIVLPYSGTPHATVINTPTTIDDRNAALVRTGANWSNVTNASDLTSTESDDSTSGESDRIVLPLGTTTVSLITKKSSSEGIATITLSPAVAGTPASVDLYNSSTLYQQSVLINGSLNPATTYTLTITESNTRNAASSANTIVIDGISYSVQSAGAPTYTQGPLLTTKPTVTLTDTGCSNNEDWPPTQIPNATWGALQYPGVPDTSYSVCVDDGSNHYTQTVPVATLNSGWTAGTGTTVTALIYPGAAAPPGGGAGYGTGTCP